MRFAKLLLVLTAVAMAGPALAEEPAAASSVVILRGSSAPPTPWYTPAPSPREVEIREVPYVLPYYYFALPYRIVPRHRPAAAAMHRK